MSIRQQIHSAHLLIVLVSLACTIRMPEEMARYATPDPAALAEPAVVQPTDMAALPNAVITNATVLSTPGAEPPLAPAVALIEPPSTPSTIVSEPPVPAALAELTVVGSLVKEVEFGTTISVDTINQAPGQILSDNNSSAAICG